MSIVYEYRIPDPSRPIPPAEQEPYSSRWELVPFIPEPLAPGKVVGRRVDGLSIYLGTYGMGGPGFFGLSLGSEWLVVAIWGAASWIRADGRLVEDTGHAEAGREAPWTVDRLERLKAMTLGREIQACAVARSSLLILIAGGPRFVIDESPETRLPHEGSREPRAFGPDDDLRRAVFLSPTGELWV